MWCGLFYAKMGPENAHKSTELCHPRNFVFKVHSYDWKYPENHYRSKRSKFGPEKFSFELKEKWSGGVKWRGVEWTMKPIHFEPYKERRDELHPDFFPKLWNSATRTYHNGMEGYHTRRWRISQEKMADYPMRETAEPPSGVYGEDKAFPRTCSDIKRATPGARDGRYRIYPNIDPVAAGKLLAPHGKTIGQDVWCNMRSGEGSNLLNTSPLQSRKLGHDFRLT